MWVLIAVVSTTTTTTTTPAAVTDGNVYIDDPVIISEYFSHNALNIINYVMLFGALMGSGLWPFWQPTTAYKHIILYVIDVFASGK